MPNLHISRLFIALLGILSLVAWTDPLPYPIDFASNSNLDEQEEVIRERIPSVVTIVDPVYNPAVRSYLNTYIFRRPEHTAQMIGWAAVYFPLFEKVLAEEGLPTDLKYLSIVESALNPCAISHSGAGGLWQFMKPTARECGLKISSYVDERMDPEKSTRAAVRYLKQLYADFNDWELVMAAYNAGPGRVRSAIKRSGKKDYWELARYLPVETQSYVPGFIAASYLMNFHSEHDLIPVYPEMAMGEMITVLVYEGMSVGEVAKRSGLTIEAVKRLNPSFIRNYIPTSSSGYALYLPYAAAELFNSSRSMEIPETGLAVDASSMVNIDGTTYKVTTTSKDYTVRSGDNLYSIAQRNKCSVRDLMTWNHLRDSRLAIGQHLEIRFTTKEVVPVITEVIPAPEVVPSTARGVATAATLPSLNMSAFPLESFNVKVYFDIEPVVKPATNNTIVLQRRQSVRSALLQNSLSMASIQFDELPNEPAPGALLKVN